MQATAAPLRLMLARSLAWAVHTSGWLVLGAVGARHAPLWLAGLLPAALWLGLLACTLQLRATRRLSAGRVRLAWLLAALLLAAAAVTTSLGLLAGAWAAASAAASWTVRLLRGPGRSPAHQALMPAVAGVFLAGGFSLPFLLASPVPPAESSVAQALCACAAGAAMTLGREAARQACRWGALDEWRGLQGLGASAWRASWARADLPLRLATVSMLPMMAGLPTLLALCTPARSGALFVVGAHLAAMVLPGAGFSCSRRLRALRAPVLCAALLMAGGVALLLRPLLEGLMWATLLHTSAWSIAWAGGLQPASASHHGAPSAARPLPTAGAAAGGVLAVGWALSALGPAALWLAHTALALFALAWAAKVLVARRPTEGRRFGRGLAAAVKASVSRRA